MSVNRNLLFILALLTLITLATVGQEIRVESTIDNDMQLLSTAVNREDWSQASSIARDLEEAWHKRKFWIALNNSTQDQQTFERTLTQVQSYIKSQDKVNAAVQTALLGQIWREFGG